MVRIFVGVTHKPWFDYLSGLGSEEVNFWQPTGTFRALQPGDLFLFKLKAPWNAIAGGGVFAHASLVPLSLVWEAFGADNGSATLAEMRRTIAALRRSRPLDEREDPTVACRILTQPFFRPRDRWIATPESFTTSTVVGRGYFTDEAEGLRLWRSVQERLQATPAPPQPVTGERFGAPVAMRRRLGQGAFCMALTDGYGRRCAVSGERTLPILDAAHIRSYAAGGEHEVSNGMLLRTDIHKLLDRGYVTITEDLRFAVQGSSRSTSTTAPTTTPCRGASWLDPSEASRPQHPRRSSGTARAAISGDENWRGSGGRGCESRLAPQRPPHRVWHRSCAGLRRRIAQRPPHVACHPVRHAIDDVSDLDAVGVDDPAVLDGADREARLGV